MRLDTEHNYPLTVVAESINCVNVMSLIGQIKMLDTSRKTYPNTLFAKINVILTYAPRQLDLALDLALDLELVLDIWW